jgi:hypothetical protein
MTGNSTVIADGYGTLITPAGTFTNVLRIHSHHEEVYNYVNFGTITQIYDLYTWWKPGLHYSLMEIMYGTQNGDPISSAGWSSSSVGVNELNVTLFRLNLFPNPATENSMLEFTLEGAADVRIEISDMTGKILRSMELPAAGFGRHSVPFDVARLSDGVYFVTATINGQRATLKLLIDN